FDPSSKTWIDWPELQKKVPDVIRLGYYEDETSPLSRWNLPASHFLESWGDVLSSEGHHLAIQPMILPLFGGFSELDLLNTVMGKPKVEGPELFCATSRPHSMAIPRVASPTTSGADQPRRRPRNRPRLCWCAITRSTTAAT
ncbi:MAG: hypothetical protein DME42_12880, partial [Verrucomicrobia bacterium]